MQCGILARVRQIYKNTLCHQTEFCYIIASVSSTHDGLLAPCTHCVPYLKLDLFAINVDHSGPKLHT